MNIEYKGSSGTESFEWGRDSARSKIARTVMAMANIGGGSIVIGMDQIGADRWQANGVRADVDAGYQQDSVQQYINQRADPYVELAVRHVDYGGRRFIVIQVSGFAELPVVCTRNGAEIREAAIYTRSFEKHESAEIRTQSEMRELLDRAIEVGVQQRLRPIIEAMRETLTASPPASDIARFEGQRGDL
ncbi:MAG: ATP-binding protein [Dehalococcoidia bacterium]